jgi:hypothetical protein
MSTARARLLQLLHARVRHAQQARPEAAAAIAGPAVTPPPWRRRPFSSSVGAGASPGAGAASAEMGADPRPPPPPPPSSRSSASSQAADAAAAEWLYRRFRQRGGADLAFDVVQFFPGGTALEHHRPLSGQELDLHPRDVGLFAPSPRLAAPQRATIAVHDDKVLFRTEVARAIITADRAVLFKSTRRRGETSRMARAVLSALQAPAGAGGGAEAVGPGAATAATAGQQGGAAAAAAAAAAALPQLPFELRVLEVLLDATADYFYRKTQHLNWMLEAVGGEEGSPAAASGSSAAAAGAGGMAAAMGSSGGNGGGGGNRSAWVASAALRGGPMAALARAEPFAAMDKAHQLVPVQRFLTGVKADVQETAKAIEAVR